MAPAHDTNVAPEPGAHGLGAAECGPAAGQAATPALEVRNLTLAWEGSETPTVSDVSLAVAPGEMVCLVGRSGCGKSTLFHGMAGLTTPVSGSVLLHGEDVTGRPGRVSYMLQKDLLLPQRTIMANVCLPLTLAGAPRAAAREKAEPLFERFGLNGTQDSYRAACASVRRSCGPTSWTTTWCSWTSRSAPLTPSRDRTCALGSSRS